jgi:hypothetical protein
LGFKTNFPTLEALTQHECKIDVDHFNQLSKQLLGPLKDSLRAYLLNKINREYCKMKVGFPFFLKDEIFFNLKNCISIYICGVKYTYS